MVFSSCNIVRHKNPSVILKFSRFISIGDQISLIRRITAEDVKEFAKLTGDLNPIHIDAEYSKQTRYGRCIVHGTFVQGLVSCLLGVHFPGTGCVAYAISCRFPEALFVDETCRIEAVVSKLRGRLATFDVNAYACERNAMVLAGHFDVFLTREQLSMKPPVNREIVCSSK
ncbi:unnamed protein product [Heterobilharzia americana]|nr:unnamed protein product [Heterobilharzia americana]